MKTQSKLSVKKATTKPIVAAPVVVAPQAPVVKRKRRRRRASSELLAARAIAEVKRRERQFIRDASTILTDALGFPVRLSRVKAAGQPLSPAQRKARRMTKKQAHAQITEAFRPLPTKPAKGGGVSFKVDSKLNDRIPF